MSENAHPPPETASFDAAEAECIPVPTTTSSSASKDAILNPVFPSTQKRKLCSLGTGEVVHILYFSVRSPKDEAMVDLFETEMQKAARDLYTFESGITDVRVCHPRCGQVSLFCFLLLVGDLFYSFSGAVE